jgi:arabinose-5-phosphate isomerase
MLNNHDIIQLAKEVITTEANTLKALSARIDESFASAVNMILTCKGRVIITGMGKSGHVAGKIAATLASTGTPAFFVHPGEASHGDLGMITREDLVIAISNSGETHEVLTLLPMLIRFDIPFISITSNRESTLANKAAIHLDLGTIEEACPLGLAPTSSTTATLALGDALAVAALKSRGFTKEDFAMSHPGGSLGKRLLIRVNDLMHSGDSVPIVSENNVILDALVEMTQKGLGMTCVIDENRKLKGIYTDGDIRRTLTAHKSIDQALIKEVMTKTVKTISGDQLAAEALEVMEKRKITSLVVTNNAGEPEGIIHMHDILNAGIA